MLSDFLLLPHIPKTGGSSFRHSLLESLSDRNIICDYGKDNKVSSKYALDSISMDSYAFFSKLFSDYDSSKGCLIGHFPVTKYAHFFNHKNIGVFFRKPVDQVVSHYEHKKRIDNYDGTLIDFICDTRNQNLQSRYIDGFPVGLLGFIGLLDRYQESIDVFNKNYDLDLEVGLKNVNKTKKVGRSYTISEEVIDIIKEKNQSDEILYAKAEKIFFSRYQSFLANEGIIFGEVTALNSRMVKGWALDGMSSQPLNIQIIRNGLLVSTVAAKDFCSSLSENNTDRNSCVGFEYIFGHALGDNEKLECIVERTGEALVNDFR